MRQFVVEFNESVTYGQMRKVMKSDVGDQLDFFHEHVNVKDESGADLDLDDLPLNVAVSVLQQAFEGFMTTQP